MILDKIEGMKKFRKGFLKGKFIFIWEKQNKLFVKK